MSWVSALKEWNSGKETWCIPKKGTDAHAEVLAIIQRRKAQTQAPPAPPPAPRPAPAKRNRRAARNQIPADETEEEKAIRLQKSLERLQEKTRKMELKPPLVRETRTTPARKKRVVLTPALQAKADELKAQIIRLTSAPQAQPQEYTGRITRSMGRIG